MQNFIASREKDNINSIPINRPLKYGLQLKKPTRQIKKLIIKKIFRFVL
jgi:hypothetical protein